MSITSKVRQTVVLTADGNLQSLVNTPTTSTATNIKQINIMNIFGMATGADAEIKIYNETGSATAKNLVFHGKFGSADTEMSVSLTYKSVSADEPTSSISLPESLNAVSTLTSTDTI